MAPKKPKTKTPKGKQPTEADARVPITRDQLTDAERKRLDEIMRKRNGGK